MAKPAVFIDVSATTQLAFRAAVVAGVLMAGVMGGCAPAARPGPAAATQVDRLIRAYPELSGGRFLVIADFENPRHMELVQLVNLSNTASTSLNDRRGRPDTGSTCLHFAAGSADDAVRFSNDTATSWYLKRDWRDYDLLLMSVHVPREGLTLRVVLDGGLPRQRQSLQTDLRLVRGWNTIRLDLADVAEHLPLDDVHSLRLSVSGMDRPVDVYVDDLLLTAYRPVLSGDPRREGSLYVQQVGRRWAVGVAGRFEFTFAQGQIVQMFNLAGDPHRLHNLVRGTVLGPMPMPVAGEGVVGEEISRSDKRVQAWPRIVEMNEVRVVIATDWRFTHEAEAAQSQPPAQRWLYTMYAGGQMAVTVETTAGSPTWSDALGLGVSLAAGSEGGWVCRTLARPMEERGASLAHATARHGPSDSLLLFAPAPGSGVGRIVEQADEVRRRRLLLALDGAGEVTSGGTSGSRTWHSLLYAGGSGEITEQQAAARAMAYLDPRPLPLEIGRPARVGAGASEVGFDHASGSYVIHPDQDQVRFVLDGRERAWHEPVFTVLAGADRSAWVYVNHLIFEPVARDAEGNVVFQLPGTLRDRQRVEVLLRPLEAGRSP